MPLLTVSEIFGPTYQGEGPSAGQRAVFLRLANCNLYCSWCDTPYSWDWTGRNGTKYDRAVGRNQQPIVDVSAALIERGVLTGAMLVVTGGEPMLQEAELVALYHRLGTSFRIEVETNGTKAATTFHPQNVYFNVSPKLANSGMPEQIRLNWPILRSYAKNSRAIFKFVVERIDDLIEVELIRDHLQLEKDRVWIMPQARNRTAHNNRIQALRDAVIDAGYNLTARLQILAWNDERGH